MVERYKKVKDIKDRVELCNTIVSCCYRPAITDWKGLMEDAGLRVADLLKEVEEERLLLELLMDLQKLSRFNDFGIIIPVSCCLFFNRI